MNVLTFQLAARCYAVELDAVEEVLPLGPLTAVPAAPPALLGAVNVKGQVCPVLDLAPLLRREACGSPPSAVGLLVQHAGCRAVLNVGRIKGVLRLAAGAQLITTGAGIVSAVIASPRAVVHIIDVGEVYRELRRQLDEAAARCGT